MTHLHLETVFHRQSSDEAWSVLTSYALDERSGEIIAETFETYRNFSRPQADYRKSRGQIRIGAERARQVSAGRLAPREQGSVACLAH